MTETRELDSLPGLGGAYAKALRGGVLSAVPLPPGAGKLPGLGSSSGGGLPDVELLLADVELDREHLSRYQDVCGFRVDDRLPVTYLHVVAFPMAMSLMTDGDFPFPLLGMVHIANRISTSRQLSVEARPTFRVSCADLRDHDKGQQFDVVTEATVDGEAVWTGRSTYLRRGGGSGGSGEKKSKDSEAPERPVATWSVPGNIGQRYGAVSGDRNPIHMHPLSARLFGFPKAIAHGMWTAAHGLASFEARLPEALTFDVKFGKPLLIPSKVDFAASSTDDGWRFTVRDRKSGAPHVTGSTTAS
jgi:acyl dehydratase